MMLACTHSSEGEVYLKLLKQSIQKNGGWQKGENVVFSAKNMDLSTRVKSAYRNLNTENTEDTEAAQREEGVLCLA